MSDRPRYTMRQSMYQAAPSGMGGPTAYAMILDTWYCYREVWRVELALGHSGRGHTDGMESATRIVNAAAVEKLAELEAEHEAWVAAT